MWSEVTYAAGLLVLGGCALTLTLWRQARSETRLHGRKRATLVWREIAASGVFGSQPGLKLNLLIGEIGRVYERDPHAETFPLPHAIRLVETWVGQQVRLEKLRAHLDEMRLLRGTLLEKQALLHDLGDDNSQLERTLARIERDLAPLEQDCNALRASCARLEAIVTTVDAAARRRELHREVGELTAGFHHDADALALADEQLDLERQIGREIETFLELERETDARLREL